MLVVVALVMCFLGTSRPTLAWGPFGHSVVAIDIANKLGLSDKPEVILLPSGRKIEMSEVDWFVWGKVYLADMDHGFFGTDRYTKTAFFSKTDHKESDDPGFSKALLASALDYIPSAPIDAVWKRRLNLVFLGWYLHGLADDVNSYYPKMRLASVVWPEDKAPIMGTFADLSGKKQAELAVIYDLLPQVKFEFSQAKTDIEGLFGWFDKETQHFRQDRSFFESESSPVSQTFRVVVERAFSVSYPGQTPNWSTFYDQSRDFGRQANTLMGLAETAKAFGLQEAKKPPHNLCKEVSIQLALSSKIGLAAAQLQGWPTNETQDLALWEGPVTQTRVTVR